MFLICNFKEFFFIKIFHYIFSINEKIKKLIKIKTLNFRYFNHFVDFDHKNRMKCCMIDQKF